jgi:hypothetical protein
MSASVQLHVYCFNKYGNRSVNSTADRLMEVVTSRLQMVDWYQAHIGLWQSPFLHCLAMYVAFMFPLLVRRRICYLVDCKMHLCQFRPLFGRRLTTEVGVWGPDIVFRSRSAGSSSHLEEPPGLSGSHRKWRFRRTTPINTTLALLRRDHAVMEITLCQMSPYGTLFVVKHLRGGLCLQVLIIFTPVTNLT